MARLIVLAAVAAGAALVLVVVLWPSLLAGTPLETLAVAKTRAAVEVPTAAPPAATKEAEAPATAAATTAAAQEPSKAEASPATAEPAKERRIVAVGDLHGDMAQARRTLLMAGIIDKEGNWAAGENIFVQTGDIVDRGPDTIELYTMMMRLAKQAAEHGGEVVQLLGNHEVMNMADDLRYVVPGDFESFGGADKRREAFDKDGWLGRYLRTLRITANINGTVFFHGGANPRWARLGVEGMNAAARAGLAGRTAEEIWGVALFGGDGPLWYRGYATDGEAAACGRLDAALAALGAQRMVVGHTPQAGGRVLRRCAGRFFVIDVGIARVYGGHSAALEIVGARVSALYPGRPPVRLA
ncbi:hypothetical protein HK105_202222 [Polyrhizophydium stewartii]|uniref:Calcineurin-like phosphoesterase domain-containing protein n=1 Tax=Polyrhizophydium stewartii TaxID=2732419 RepID=A0ABR4NFJ4_9FUNG|nr:hypothetical protein HK105_007703 [Polyrhizophydium stewartii]